MLVVCICDLWKGMYLVSDQLLNNMFNFFDADVVLVLLSTSFKSKYGDGIDNRTTPWKTPLLVKLST